MHRHVDHRAPLGAGSGQQTRNLATPKVVERSTDSI